MKYMILVMGFLNMLAQASDRKARLHEANQQVIADLHHDAAVQAKPKKPNKTSSSSAGSVEFTKQEETRIGRDMKKIHDADKKNQRVNAKPSKEVPLRTQLRLATTEKDQPHSHVTTCLHRLNLELVVLNQHSQDLGGIKNKILNEAGVKELQKAQAILATMQSLLAQFKVDEHKTDKT